MALASVAYRQEPSDAEASAWGLTIEEASAPAVDLLPDCEAALRVFIAMRTQWRAREGGPIGLDYVALEAVMRMQRIPSAERASLLDDVQVMEQTALDLMHAQIEARHERRH